MEMMVAATLLTFVGMAFITALIQNQRMALAIAYRTMATTTALSISEQLRYYVYGMDGDKKGIEPVYLEPGTKSFEVDVPDPTSGLAVKGLLKLNLPINTKDGAGVPEHTQWTEIDLPFTYDASLTNKSSNIRVPIRYWLSVRKRESTQTAQGITYKLCELYEIALIYQWRNPNHKGGGDWQSGVIRVVTPNRDLNSAS